MAAETALEQKLKQLIQNHLDLTETCAALFQENNRQQALIERLQTEVTGLKNSLDEMAKDRFILKRFRDERRLLRRKLEAALKRLHAMEEEILS